MARISPLALTRAQDASGNAVAGATLAYYRAGTSTPTAIYSDVNGRVSLGTSLASDSAGFFAVHYLDDPQDYKAVLTIGGVSRVYDWLQEGANSGGGGGVSDADPLVLADIATLRAETWGGNTPTLVQLVNNWATGDGGGLFRVDSADTTTADNGGTVIVDSVGTRWKRQFVGAVDARWFGVRADGTTDDTAALQSAITASSGRELVLPPGVIVVTTLTGVSNIIISGAGKHLTTIRRKASASVGTMLLFSAATKIALRDFALDGNKASQTAGGNNLALISGCAQYDIERIRSVGAKANSGYGTGVVIQDGAAISTRFISRIVDCEFDDNDTSGLLVDEEWSLLIQGNSAHRNGDCGIDITNTDLPFEVERQNRIQVLFNQCSNNGNCGIRMFGFVTGSGPVATPDYTPFNPSGVGSIVQGNRCTFNTKYGIAWQQAFGQVVANHCESNGDSISNGDYLCNGWGTVFANNTSHDAAGGYGIDAGGCYHCVISNNNISYSGLTSGLQAVGLNIGGSNVNIVEGNVFVECGVSGGGYQIAVLGIEGDGTATGTYNWNTARLSLRNNVMQVTGSQIGIYVAKGVRALTMAGNEVLGAASGNAFQIECSAFFDGGGNVDWSNGGIVPTLASAATLVVPDVGRQFFVSGTTGITKIVTRSQNVWEGKVRFVAMTAPTPGTTRAYSAAPTVSFSGGGGAGAAGTALLDNDGYVVQIEITNPGSGYTSAPTIAFSGGTVTSGSVDPSGSPQINCNNQEGREIVLMFQGALTVTDGAAVNNDLAGNLTTTANKNILVLRGAYGNWYEVSRSTL